ncbi:phosphonate metabolism protein/1,5-bisphosphokinase (PRPP-forming) PhnN [Cribrihabitans neustonicus]|uniref:phosphonate metabolism protein/1,5-bisphosphokinase (PRPP-forming) PhnN n=1 Tax=Cribrihabitans neustonicus TaxID=1429085 RepID=UPI003B5912EF
MSPPRDAPREAPVIAVVGPSGAGKDSLMLELSQAVPGLRRVRRVITRAPEAGGENYRAVSVAEFSALAEADAFALHWQAHGLHYGIPREIGDLRMGAAGVLVNLSRGVLPEAQARFGNLIVLSVSAAPGVLAARLAARGREAGAALEGRLARAACRLPPGLACVHEIDNSGRLADAVAAAVAALQPERG